MWIVGICAYNQSVSMFMLFEANIGFAKLSFTLDIQTDSTLDLTTWCMFSVPLHLHRPFARRSPSRGLTSCSADRCKTSRSSTVRLKCNRCLNPQMLCAHNQSSICLFHKCSHTTLIFVRCGFIIVFRSFCSSLVVSGSGAQARALMVENNLVIQVHMHHIARTYTNAQ